MDDAFNEVTKFHSNLMQLPRVHHVKRVCRLMEKKSGLTKLVLNSGNTTSRDITKFDLKDRTTW